MGKKQKTSMISDIFSMNKTLKLLIISDIFVFSGLGLVGPILAIFIKDNLVGGSILGAGIASTIYLLTHSLLQILFAYIFNPKDRLWMLVLGTGMMVIVPFGYIFSTNMWHLYLVQFIYGAAAGFAYPSWSSIFTSNLEKGKRGFQWSIYSSSVGIGTSITAVAGAWLAEKTSFQLVFALAGIIALVGLIFLFYLEKKSIMKKI